MAGVEEIKVIIPEEVYLPAYRHLLTDTSDVKLLFGGRDSGKTHFIAQLMIEKCLSMPYFRCVLAKKTHESIKDAQWQAIKDVAEDWGVDHLFQFKTSPLEITCVNGNKFITRGLDKPGKIRGVTNPSHLWVEEANQIKEADYINLSTTMRSNKGRVEEWLAYNPEAENGEPEKFWLYRKFYKGVKNIYENFTRDTETKLITGDVVKLTYSSTHTTYLDNPYCSVERRAKLEELKIFNPYYYDVFCLGKWGQKRTGQEMFSQFWSRQVHVRPCSPNFDHPFHLWFDFNRVPYSTCYVVQFEKREGKMYVKLINEICLEPPTNSIEHTEVVFSAKYSKCKSIYYSGDPTGKNETQQKTSMESRSMFDQVDRSFRKYIHNTSNMVPSKAPPLATRKQAFIDILTGRKNIILEVDPKCVKFMNDIETAMEDVTGGWLKKQEKSESLGKRVEVIGHSLDAVTYGLFSHYPHLFKAMN